MISPEKLVEVSTFIDENILHNSVWVETDSNTQKRAVYNAALNLTNLLSKYFVNPEEIPIDILSNQTIWLLRIDDTFLRAEMGATYIQMSGVMVNIKDKDRSIAPYVLDVLGITPDPQTGGLTKRKVGSYSSRQVGTDSSIYRRG